MIVAAATSSDLAESVECLADAFAHDPITGYLLQSGPGYRERIMDFFSLLMRARLALGMPILVARGGDGIRGAAMGYVCPEWPADLAEEWNRFEKSIPDMTERMAVYDAIVNESKPSEPHYYLGVIGIAPRLHGRGFGRQLIDAFCDLSANDELSRGVFLETAQESNVGFYERCGFAEVGRGSLGSATLWCLYRRHGSR